MKRFTSIAVMTFILSLLFAGVKVNAAEPELNVSKKTVYVGTMFNLKLKNAKEKVTWESSDDSVARVFSDGLVVTLKKGKATIKAKYDGTVYGCTVTVKNPELNKTKLTLEAGEEFRLKMTGSNPQSWSSSKKAIASIDAGGLLYAKEPGTSTITVKCEDGNSYTCKVTVKKPAIEVGDTIIFGTCEQDNNEYNGWEPIEWIVLDIDKDNALVISKYGLRCCAFYEINPYDSDQKDFTWDVSLVHDNLNNPLYTKWFTSEEKEKIIETVVDAEVNTDYSQPSGKATKDHLFLLSISEYKKYKNIIPKCESVASATFNDFHVRDGWWLRTAGKNEEYTAYVASNGTLNTEGGDSYSSGYQWRLVRPAMWIKIK